MRFATAPLVVVALTVSAWAAPPAAPSASSSDRAREYTLADFDAAIVEFKQSYEIAKAPRLLFNIAQAYRLKKDYESALFFYNTYLRAETNAPNREDVESKIDEMRRALEHERGGGGGGGGKVEPPRPRPVGGGELPKPPPTAAELARERRTHLIAGGVTMGAGVVVAGVGAGMLGLAASDASKLHDVAKNNEMWSSHFDDVYREGERSQTAGVVLLAVGGAAIVAGGIVAIIGSRIHPPARR
jgi:F0F1-type ATP synthase membrane subunit c/vacuolar-type H+-ATPase subunit K